VEVDSLLVRLEQKMVEKKLAAVVFQLMDNTVIWLPLIFGQRCSMTPLTSGVQSQ
jgi:hypothetical protein